MKSNIDPLRVRLIIDNRLAHAPMKIKDFFPKVLSLKPVSWVTISPPEYLMVAFLNPGDENRINELISKRFDPFPGLITLNNQGAAFRVEKSRNMLIQDSKVKNSYTLSLGVDSTIIVSNHTQSIKTKELGQIEYHIPLAYIVSYGHEINKATVYEYFEGLIAYSINIWRGTNA